MHPDRSLPHVQGVPQLDQQGPRRLSRGGAPRHRRAAGLSAGQDGGLRRARRQRQGPLRPARPGVRSARRPDGPLLRQLPAGRDRSPSPSWSTGPRRQRRPAAADVRRARRLPDPGQPARIRRLLRAPAGASPRGDERAGGRLVRHARAARERGHQGAVRLARETGGGPSNRRLRRSAEGPGRQRQPEAEKPLGAEPLPRAGSVPQGGRRAVLRARGVGRSALERVPRSCTRRRPTARRRSGCWRSSAHRARASRRSRRRGCWRELDSDPLPGRPAPIDVVFTPEARPLESLAVALARQASDDPAPAKKAIEFEEVLRSARGPRRPALSRRADAGRRRRRPDPAGRPVRGALFAVRRRAGARGLHRQPPRTRRASRAGGSRSSSRCAATSWARSTSTRS